MQKKIVITVSRVFPRRKKRQGEPTGFREKLASGEKIHTIRSNFDLWNINAEKMRRGDFHLSVRQWIGRPYHSPQLEFMRISEPIGVERISMEWNAAQKRLSATVNGNTVDPRLIAHNDGLSMEDFTDWFFEEEKRQHDARYDGVVVHFTKFRYHPLN